MAISDTQKVDLLYKKIAWAATKTDTNPPKEAYNEANPSPLLIRGDTLWQLSASIPASIPATTSSVVQVYKDGGGGGYTATVECTELAVTDNRTWSTGLTNWIDPQFGSTYFAKVYVDTAGSTTPQTTGTALQAAGLNDDQWYFDYQSGILNFIGSNLPASIATGITGKSVFISGARYIGPTGVVTWENGLTIGNITINGNTISSTNGNATIISTGNISAGNISAGNFIGNIRTDYISSSTSNVIVITGTGALTLPVGNVLNRPIDPLLGELRYNTDASINAIEYYNGNVWVSGQASITGQQITPDGVSVSYALDEIVATAESILVSINGTVQRPGATGAYNITTGNTIVFSETPATTDIIDLRYIASARTPQLIGLTTDIETTGNVSFGNVDVTGNMTIGGNIVPGANVTYSLGTSTKQWRDLWVSNNTIYIGNTPITVSNGTLLINNSPITGGSTYSNTNVAAYLTTGNISTSNITATGNISATGSILATPAWTSAGAITISATTTAPTKPTTRVKDNISYRQLGAKQWEVVISWLVSDATGATNGTGDYLFTLPNSLQFDTTLPSQSVYTGNVASSVWAHIGYIIPSGSGLITNNSVGGQVHPMVYSSTQFRILGTTPSSGVAPWGSAFFALNSYTAMQLTFRFTSA